MREVRAILPPRVAPIPAWFSVQNPGGFQPHHGSGETGGKPKGVNKESSCGQCRCSLGPPQGGPHQGLGPRRGHPRLGAAKPSCAQSPVSALVRWAAQPPPTPWGQTRSAPPTRGPRRGRDPGCVQLSGRHLPKSRGWQATQDDQDAREQPGE